MNKKSYIVIGVVIVVVVGLYLAFAQKNEKYEAPANTNNTATSDVSGVTDTTQTSNPTSDNSAMTAETKGQYTLADVAVHSSASSCWSAVNGGVYDLTKWIDKHPGGREKILGICGKDGSDAFNGKHGGQARPASELATFKIGVLK